MQSSRYVLAETVAIAAVASADLLYTSYLIASGGASEANPLMLGALRRFGPYGMVALKALLVAVPLSIAEAARTRHPQTVRTLLRLGLALYVCLWLIGTLIVNLRR